MKTIIKNLFDEVRKDRAVLLMCFSLVVVAIIYGIYMSLSLGPIENQIAVRYTAYGETNLYRNHWYYLISFIVFAVLVAIIHCGLIAKLTERGMRPLALSLGWLTLLFFVILFVLSRSILGNAYFL